MWIPLEQALHPLPPMHGTWRALAAWNQAELWLTGLVRGTKVLVLVDSSAKRQVESN